MRINLAPFVLWAFLGIVGFLLAGPTGALVGLAAGLGVTLLVTVFL